MPLTWLMRQPAARAAAEGPRPVRLLNWNVASPSESRARAQCDWILARDPDAVVLTEVKTRQAAELFCTFFRIQGFSVVHRPSGERGYRALAAARGRLQPTEWQIAYAPERVSTCEVALAGGAMAIVGVYVPSRGPRERRNVAKRAFQDAFCQSLRRYAARVRVPLVVAGDLNVVEPGHVPAHKVFGRWEYDFYRSFGDCGLVDAFRALHPETVDHSWYGRQGNGYRFDHVFVSEALRPRLQGCWYDHSVRRNRLSDHAAMWATIDPLLGAGEDAAAPRAAQG